MQFSTLTYSCMLHPKLSDRVGYIAATKSIFKNILIRKVNKKTVEQYFFNLYYGRFIIQVISKSIFLLAIRGSSIHEMNMIFTRWVSIHVVNILITRWSSTCEVYKLSSRQSSIHLISVLLHQVELIHVSTVNSLHQVELNTFSLHSLPQVELDELQVLRTVHVSLKALLQMISAVHKDLRSMSDNYKQRSGK